MYYTNEQVLALFKKIEQQLNVNQMLLFGMCIWPYLRTSLKLKLDSYSVISSPDHKPPAQVPVKVKISQLLRDFVKSVWRYPVMLIFGGKRTDFLFLSPSFFDYAVGETKVDRILSGMEAHMEKNGLSYQYFKYSVFELSKTEQGLNGANISAITYFLNQLCKFWISRRESPVDLPYVDDINAILQAEGIPVRLEKHKVYYELKRLLWMSKIFERLIKKHSVKHVIIPVYYNFVGLAMCLACRRQGIESIEYQHGAQSQFHSTYVGWNKVPEEGYALMPSSFWVWGDANFRRINHWAERTKVTVKVSGNAWLDYLQNNALVEPLVKQDISGSNSAKKIALLCLQRFPQHYKSFITSAMRDASENIVWVIKEHPAYPLTDQQIDEQFGSLIESGRVQLDRTHTTYSLLGVADVCLTAFSTVAFESEYYGVPSILFHEDGVDGHADYLSQCNGITFANDTTQLLEKIERAFKPEKFNGTYIQQSFLLPVDQ